MARQLHPLELLGAGTGPVAVVVAHPDDEIIGAGHLLRSLPDAVIIYVTDGAPHDMADARAAGCMTREAYAERRRRERAAALTEVGLGPDRTRDLGAVDQQASYELSALALRLRATLDALRPAAVLTHSYEGGHPDHDATAFIVHAAAGPQLGSSRRPTTRGGAPPIIELTSYHASGGRRVVGVFIPHPAAGPEVSLALTAAARRRKARLYAYHRSQIRVLADCQVDVERFRRAPAYDFSRPPHAGVLWYERFGWGMPGGGRQWRALAAAARAELGLVRSDGGSP